MPQFSKKLCKLDSSNLVYIMVNELLYIGIETEAPCFHASMFILFFLFRMKICISSLSDTIKIISMKFARD